MLSGGAQKMFNIPPITGAILAIIFIAYAILFFLPMREFVWVVMHFGFTPAPWVGRSDFSFWYIFSPLTHLFLHGSFLHLFLNSFMMLAFGSGVEKMIGSRRYILLIGLCALGGIFAQSLLNLDSTVPMIGISAVVNGLFAAILVLMFATGDNNMRRGLIPFIVLWIVITVGFGFISTPGFDSGTIAWAAHLGGFFAGLAGASCWIKQKK